MTEGQRSLAAVLAGLLVWFGAAQAINPLVAPVLGALGGGLVWLLTAGLRRRDSGS